MAAGQGCRAPAPFRRWKDIDDSDNDNDDAGDDDNAAGKGGHNYEVTVRYKLV